MNVTGIFEQIKVTDSFLISKAYFIIYLNSIAEAKLKVN